MDTVQLVNENIDDGKRVVSRLLAEGVPLDVAFWARTTRREDRWSFYLATPLRDEKGPLAAYTEVDRVIRMIDDLWPDPFSVRILSPTDQMAVAVRELRDRRPTRLPLRVEDDSLAQAGIAEAVIYRPIRQMTRDEILITWSRLLNLPRDTGGAARATITLEGGQQLQGVPTGIEGPEIGDIRLLFRSEKSTRDEDMVEVGKVLHVH